MEDWGVAILWEIGGNSRKIQIWGLGRVQEKRGPEAPYNYSASFSTKNLPSSLWGKLEHMVFGLGGRAHDAQNQLFLTLETQNNFNKFGKFQNDFTAY